MSTQEFLNNCIQIWNMDQGLQYSQIQKKLERLEEKLSPDFEITEMFQKELLNKLQTILNEYAVPISPVSILLIRHYS